MKYASDFRQIARDALKGMWTAAVIVGLIAALLGGTGSSGPELTFEINEYGAGLEFSVANQTIYSTWGGFDAGILAGAAVYVIIAALVMAVIYFILGSVVGVGYANFNLRLVDRRNPGYENLFEYFRYWKNTAATKLLCSVYVLLWSLLFIIPGIVASYSYAMTDFILAENPELRASEAASASKEMMEGNRWRLFCLQFSFIGWGILCTLTAGIGNLWLTPYEQAAKAAFYREISGTFRGA